MNLSVLNSLCYTIGWFWCVLFGIHGHSIIATLGAIFLIAIQLYCAKIENIALYIQDALLAMFSVPLGVLLETFFIQTGIIHYVNSTSALPPIWIVSLYPLFSLLLNHSLKIVKTSYHTAFLFGFIGAGLSYFAGESLGGLILIGNPGRVSWVGIGWGLLLCLLVKISHSIEKATDETLAERDSNTRLKLLYDGKCPICKKEICMLQKKTSQRKINFIDISSHDYSSAENNNVDYNTAMSQMHAIDGDGNLLVGIPAFAAVYARCQLLIISTLMRIPFMNKVLQPFYRIFAKNRLWITGRKNTNIGKNS